MYKDLIDRLRERRMPIFKGATLVGMSNSPDSDCAAAADALESMQADAARYRWLRGNYNETLDLVQALQLFTPEGLDAAIDAARGEE